LIFLDYDGTLAPIASRPEQAFMPRDTRRILERLVENKHISVFIISGRSLRHVKELSGIKGIYYAGCHGLEIEGSRPAGPVTVSDKLRVSVKQAKLLLIRELADIIPVKDFDIEDKGIILSLHYRRVNKRHLTALKDIFYRVSRPYTARGEMVITKNKKVIELRPRINWDKGMYCLYMLNRFTLKGRKAMPVYIGDDRTDETAFKALKKKGVTVFVKGERKTSLAEYYVNSTNEVKNFLQLIGDSLKDRD
jgi:trehalose 6-phosphate phosphatase